jgi:hypothetical protein
VAPDASEHVWQLATPPFVVSEQDLQALDFKKEPLWHAEHVVEFEQVVQLVSKPEQDMHWPELTPYPELHDVQLGL